MTDSCTSAGGGGGRLDAALQARVREERIRCADVFAVARELEVPVAEAGRAVQRLRIKIAGCQLGCFK